MINGGFFSKREHWPAPHPSVVIALDDIKEGMEKVADAGGKVLGEPMEIPGYGMSATTRSNRSPRWAMCRYALSNVATVNGASWCAPSP